MISKDPALPDGASRRTGAHARRRRRALPLRAADPRVPRRRCTARCSTAGRDAAHRRRDAGRHGRGGAAVHRPRPARGRHGVPVRARRASTTAATSGTSRPLDLRDLKAIARPLAGRPRRGRLEQPLLEQPRPAAGRVAVRRRRRAPRAPRRRCSATVLHLHRGTPYVYQGEELGMTNAPFATDRRLPRHRVGQPLRRGGRARARTPRPCWPRCAPMSRDNARTPMQWDAAPNAGFTTGDAVDRRSTPTTTEINAAAAARRPRLGLPPLPPADRAAPHRAGRRPRRLHDAAAGRRARSTRSPGALGDAELLVLANFSGEPPTKVERPGRAAPGRAPRCC